jgi:hypothetical protein
VDDLRFLVLSCERAVHRLQPFQWHIHCL